MGRYEADHILFGAAYYDEYLMMKGIDRVDEDMRMMKEAGLNVIRIAESTWSTWRTAAGCVRLHLCGSCSRRGTACRYRRHRRHSNLRGAELARQD